MYLHSFISLQDTYNISFTVWNCFSALLVTCSRIATVEVGPSTRWRQCNALCSVSFCFTEFRFFFLLSSRRTGWGRWSALRCSDVKLLLSAYRFFHVSFPSWEHKCSMLDNLLLSCLNIFSNTIDILLNYNVYVLGPTCQGCCHRRFLSTPTSHARKKTSFHVAVWRQLLPPLFRTCVCFFSVLHAVWPR